MLKYQTKKLVARSNFIHIKILPSHLTKNPPAGLKRIRYFPVISIHIASSMIAITMSFSSEYHQHASCLGANFAGGAFQTALMALFWDEGFVPSEHSKHQDLSCHCSWLSDCIFALRAHTLWSFRTLANSKFVLAWGFSSVGYYCLIGCSMPRRAFRSGKGHWLLQLGYRRCCV